MKIIPDTLDIKGSVYDMIKSGARGNISQVVQMAGMKGLIINTSGETIAFPIINSMKEGLTRLNTSLPLTAQEKVWPIPRSTPLRPVI